MRKIIQLLLFFTVLIYGQKPTQDNVTELYIATFDRVPDKAGLEYWLYDSNLELEEIAMSFFDQPETKQKYPDTTSVDEFIKSVYNNLFNRDPDSAGLEYWKDELNAETIHRSEFILAVINGALGSDYEILKSKTLNALNSLNLTTPPTINQTDYQLIAWNDLGMHCMDGKDYSVFSILPPYNTLVAHLIYRGKEPEHIKGGVTMTYRSVRDSIGRLNSYSDGKTNFWKYADKLFGKNLQPNEGLTGNYFDGNLTKQQLVFDIKNNWWVAEGIPITPINDNGSYNMYPKVQVTATDSNGNILAQTTTVLPVSNEMDCKKCHSSSSQYSDAKPSSGWANLSDSEKDYKVNILRLHDQEHPDAVSKYIDELKTKWWNYDTKGLEATANSGTPILCASCHKSNALKGTGVADIIPLTQAIHTVHAEVTDPSTGLTLDDTKNRNSCYACHPGQETKCLRGAMGSAKNSDGTYAINCQSCHGSMKAVGSPHRDGWLDEPNCQSCHQNGTRYKEAVIDMSTGTLRDALDNRFATNLNVPDTRKSLYRFSKGHGELSCSACHGSTHAIYPSSQPEDNLQSTRIQGYEGTLSNCISCHKEMPLTNDKGPHGLHTTGQDWVKMHEDVAEDNGVDSCKVCHGQDFRGSPLSATFKSRTFDTKWGTKTFDAKHQISCYDCHNGPDGDD